MPIFVLPLHPKSEVILKTCRIYLLLFVFGVLLGGMVAADAKGVETGVIPAQAVTHVFASAVTLPCGACEQAPSIDAPGSAVISFSLNIKDYHNYVDDPFTRNRRIELQAVSYLFYSRVFPSSHDLSSLQRLNV